MQINVERDNNLFELNRGSRRSSPRDALTPVYPDPHFPSKTRSKADLQRKFWYGFDDNIVDHLLCLRVPEDVYG